MPIERQSFLTILEDSFSAYYDIVPQEHPTLPLVFRGDYLKRDERYWLMKSIPIWASETGEFAYIFSAEQFSPELAKACIDFMGLLIADSAQEETRRLVQKSSFTKNYHHSFWGFSNLLAAIVDLQEKKTYPNKAGYALEKYFRKLFDVRKEEG